MGVDISDFFELLMISATWYQKWAPLGMGVPKKVESNWTKDEMM